MQFRNIIQVNGCQWSISTVHPKGEVVFDTPEEADEFYNGVDHGFAKKQKKAREEVKK